ncbi:MAG: DUF5916 domain-containing protein [Cytophagales bacterium]|nr:DUF5916 domain-containing protein [Cytophagales bacterium]
MKKLALILILKGLFFASYSQEAEIFRPDSPKLELRAVETTSVIKIDGILDETVWSEAPKSPSFTQVDPNQKAKPSQDTDVKVLFDSKFLYFGIFCMDSLGKSAIRATDFKRDFDHRTHDLININFDAFNSERNAMTFAVNPYGVQRDYLSFDALYYDIDWDAIWQARTSITYNGWIAEIAIPWKTIRYPHLDNENQQWGIQIYRNRRIINEISAFSPFPQTYPSARMDYAGLLKGIQPPPPAKTNIRIQPYALTSIEKHSTSDSQEEVDPDIKIGGEVKWAVSSNDVLDLTFNTDFAQADVDRQINNTSRFSVFFPERRQFFLENASLFGINVNRRTGDEGAIHIQPFFSRRIGLDEESKPIPIVAGARFVHGSATTNYGGIAIRQEGDSLTSATNFIVGRYSKNFGKQNRVGGLMTIKNQPEKSNITFTTDGFFRLNEVHSLNTLVSYSQDSNSAGKGLSAIGQYYYNTNKWIGWWTQSIITKNYNPEMGFISRQDVIGTTPGVIRTFRGEKLPFKKWIRAFEPSVAIQFFHQASTGDLIERKYVLNPFYLNLQNGGYIGYGLNTNYQNLKESFVPLEVEIIPGEYDYLRHFFLASTDPSKKISVSGFVDWGNYFDGDLSSLDLTFKFVPIPHISLSTRYNRIGFSKVGVDQISKKVDLYAIEGRFAVNPRIRLTGIYQKNSENDLENINVRFTWEYQPMSYVYLVYNERTFIDDPQEQQSEQQGILKLSYVKQF